MDFLHQHVESYPLSFVACLSNRYRTDIEYAYVIVCVSVCICIWICIRIICMYIYTHTHIYICVCVCVCACLCVHVNVQASVCIMYNIYEKTLQLVTQMGTGCTGWSAESCAAGEPFPSCATENP